MLTLNEPALAAAGAATITHGVASAAETVATLAPAGAASVVPAGLDSVSPVASTGFAQYTLENIANDAAQHALASAHGEALLEMLAAYAAADAAGAVVA